MRRNLFKTFYNRVKGDNKHKQIQQTFQLVCINRFLQVASSYVLVRYGTGKTRNTRPDRQQHSCSIKAIYNAEIIYVQKYLRGI